MFSNREIAIIIWINLFLLYCLIKTDIRKPLKNLIKAAFNKKLILLYIIIYSYIAMLIYILYRIKYWNIYLLKDTLIWLITVPIFSVMKAGEDSKKYFKETLKNIIYIPMLTILYMPMTYLILVFMNYETFWFRVNCKKYLSRKDKRAVMWKAIKKCKLNLNKIKNIKLDEYVNIMEI